MPSPHPGAEITWKVSIHVTLVITVSLVPVGHLGYKNAVFKNFCLEKLEKNVSFAHFI